MINDIKLSDKFNYRKLLKYTIPSIIMMVFTSIYYVVDGYFVSNFAGKISFAAINFIIPVILILGCVGFMFGTGSGALIAKTLGEGDKKKANEVFSLIVYFSIFIAFVLAVIGLFVIKPIAILMGGEGELLKESVLYGSILLIALPSYVLQYEFQCLFSAAEKPKLGLIITILAGVTNIIFDALFIVVFKWGLVGAAIATLLGQVVGGVIPLIYFSCSNSSTLKLGKFKLDFKSIYRTCINGSSELLSNVAMSLVGLIYNYQLYKYAMENGIASYGVLMYVCMFFQAVFFGFTVGSAPIISYKFGEEKYDEVKGLLIKNLVIISSFSLSMFVVSNLLSKPLIYLFVGYDNELINMTIHAFKIFNFSFLFSGFTIMISSFFTALNDGFTSMLVTFLRTLVFQLLTIIILPIFFELDGIWMALVLSELLACVCAFIILKYKKTSLNF